MHYPVSQLRSGYFHSSRKSKMIVENEKEHCAASTSNRLTKTRIWRENLSAQYPDDSRNPRAALMLAELANDAATRGVSKWPFIARNDG
jgi:hypothetical protein